METKVVVALKRIHRAMHGREALKKRRADRDFINSGLERFK